LSHSRFYRILTYLGKSISTIHEVVNGLKHASGNTLKNEIIAKIGHKSNTGEILNG